MHYMSGWWEPGSRPFAGIAHSAPCPCPGDSQSLARAMREVFDGQRQLDGQLRGHDGGEDRVHSRRALCGSAGVLGAHADRACQSGGTRTGAEQMGAGGSGRAPSIHT